MATDRRDQYVPSSPADPATWALPTDRPQSARMYDYMIGGKDNYAIDRAAADRTIQAFPTLRLAVRHNRAFMLRAGRHIAEAGIDQFLDIGAGIPAEPNLHQVVQAVDPAARIVYVDNDPIVLAHTAALLASTSAGRTAYLHADAHDPQAILAAPELRETVDLSRPVAIMMFALLHFLDDDSAEGLVTTLLDAVPAGSVLALSQSTDDTEDPEMARLGAQRYRDTGIAFFQRSRAQLSAQFLSPLTLWEPGLVPVHRWRPDDTDLIATTPDADITQLGAVAEKPAT